MDIENFESETTPKIPNLQLAQQKFVLSLPEYQNDEARKKELYEAIVAEDMAPYYEIVCSDLKWKLNKKVLKQMKERNTQVLVSMDEDIEASLKGLVAKDCAELYLNKANYLCKIGDKENAIKVLSHAYDQSFSLKNKLDNVFFCIRIGFFFMDFKLIESNVEKAEKLTEEDTDWHSRNCFKIFKAIYSLVVRNFKSASQLLVDAISTFVCTEIITYEQFIKYTLISSVLTLSRNETKQRLIQNADMQQALQADNTFREYLYSLYNCDYKVFFQRLADIEVFMKQDMFLNPHYKSYVREMKIKAYDQLLSTYISVNLSYMSEQFGVCEDYIENDLSKFIAAGRLSYKIDKVSGIVVNQRKDRKTEVFQAVIKQGDILLNRVHKLGRVIEI
ncbi:unnamed protein product [Diabrotica balteata]|uniref:26S proteasome non-ATPase regulatory subunit 6 n=1 Tax=Diabrotica balteata TaxID=107213 RepID=A0A9N9SVK7_DIABA|nr:unnamed protein product [Diabrotica balteata]